MRRRAFDRTRPTRSSPRALPARSSTRCRVCAATKLEFTARIRLGIVTDSKELIDAVKQFVAYIQTETLTVELVFEPLPGVEPVDVAFGEFHAKLYLKVIV